MGSIDPITAAMFTLGAIQKRQQAKTQERFARGQADQQIAELRLQQQTQDRRRADALRRTQATQRARFGSQGLGGSGSASAVLDGLSAASARDAADHAGAVNTRVADINHQLGNIRRRNLLEQRNLIQNRVFGEIDKRLPRLSLLD